MRRLVLIALALAAPAVSQGGGPFTVAESGRSFGRLQDAVNAIGGGGGTIRIAAGRWHECAVQSAGRIAFVAAVPGQAVLDRTICEGKGALVLRGQGASVSGIVFEHMEVGDGNGAGIRLEKGNLDVHAAMFLDSQEGILTADDRGSRISVDHSTFAGLGNNAAGAHSIYVGGYGALSVTACVFKRGTGGHYVKSRSPRISVTDSSFDDSAGHGTNYMIDLSNGATGRIAGNDFVVGRDKENHSALITVAPEGVHNDSSGLVVEGNTARLAPGVGFQPAFVAAWTGEAVTVRRNRLGAGIPERARHWY